VIQSLEQGFLFVKFVENKADQRELGRLEIQ
jgi:hypothetical protein